MPSSLLLQVAPVPAEPFLSLLLFGGALFWSAALFFVLVLSVQVAREASGAAFLTLLLGVATLSWISRFPLQEWVRDHPGTVLRWVAVYYAGGVVWASWKFVRFHRRKVRPYLEWRTRQLQQLGVASASELDEEQAFRFQEAAAKAGFPLRTMGQVTDLRRYRRDFAFWASYWPFSLLGTLLRFVVRDAFAAIFHGAFAALGATIRRWLTRLYRDVHADRDAVLAKAEAYRARQAEAEGGEGGEGGGGAPVARRVVVRPKP
ncbi:hypothetical protein [Roseisolibacter sp. H3M3-2]|uniref:hypothetical protein n=1 Tax=Roseisolibacter sp. H3M3-2 TaxID=3031323 RepID=UPI0023DC78A4|nr:hypothetical protein [Roseisolibacter sp. H3M3-2]MDF1504450.1 hypothetical protein [Roseisolibacter sp. H3M3-2]